MKKTVAIICGCLLTASVALAAEPTEADQKWLTVVTKMVESGNTEISTPSEVRANLLKDWASNRVLRFRSSRPTPAIASNWRSRSPAG